MIAAPALMSLSGRFCCKSPSAPEQGRVRRQRIECWLRVALFEESHSRQQSYAESYLGRGLSAAAPEPPPGLLQQNRHGPADFRVAAIPSAN